MTKTTTYILSICFISVALLILLILPKFQIGGSWYSVDGDNLESNFTQNKNAFFRLQELTDSIFPENGFYIGYSESNSRFQLGLSELNWSDYNASAKSEVFHFRKKRLKIGSSITKNALDSIGLSERQFLQIIKMFKATNCIFFRKPIREHSPFYFEYGYDGSFLSSHFSYQIFNDNTPDSTILNWAKNPDVVRFSKRVYFEYGHPL